MPLPDTAVFRLAETERERDMQREATARDMLRAQVHALERLRDDATRLRDEPIRVSTEVRPSRDSLAGWYWVNRETHDYGQIYAHIGDEVLIGTSTLNGVVPRLESALNSENISLYKGAVLAPIDPAWIYLPDYQTARMASGCRIEGEVPHAGRVEHFGTRGLG